MADREVLASALYARAFDKVMSGVDPALLPDDEREALIAAREAAGMTGPGYPAPVSGRTS